MATLHVENIPDDLYAKLQQLAKSQNSTIDTEVVNLLQSALPKEIQQPQTKVGKSAKELLIEITQRREQRQQRNLDREWPDSTTLIREDRDR